MWPDACRAVAGYELPGSAALPRAPLSDSEWSHLLTCATHERVTGWLARVIEMGDLAATPAQQAAAVHEHRRAMATAVILERSLLEVLEVLGGREIEVILLKGAAVAHLDYPDPALRAFGDLDLLIRAEQFDDAVSALIGVGHQRRYPQPRPGFDRRFGKGSCLVAADGLEVDLHRSLAMGPFGVTIKLDDLWFEPTTVEIGTRRIQALGREKRFLHACIHAALGSSKPRLSALRDVAQMQTSGLLDTELVHALARSWRCEPVLARAVTLAWACFGLDAAASDLASWAINRGSTAQERRWLAVYTDHSPTYAAKAMTVLEALPNVGEKATYVRSLALPDRSYTLSRDESRARRWCRMVREGLKWVRTRVR